MKYKLLLLCSVMCLSVFSQKQRTDSLHAILKSTHDDIRKAQILNQIADSYKTYDPVQMKAYAQKALDLTGRMGDRAEQAGAYLNLGNSQIITGDYRQALKYFLEGKILLEQELQASPSHTELKRSLAKANGSIGIVFSEQSSYAKALQFHLKAARIYEQLADNPRTAVVYNNIGITYQAQHMDFKALEYFVKAQKLKERSGDSSLGSIFTNIGNIYLRQENYPDAFLYYSKAQDVLTKYDDPRALGELYNNLGLYFKHLQDDAKAFGYWRKAILEFEKVHDKFGSADAYLHSAGMHFSLKEYQKALQDSNKALQLATELNVPEQIALSRKLLSEIYAAQNDNAKALEHFRIYSDVKDSIADAENIRQSVQAEMNFEFEKREAIQKKELEEKELIYAEQSKRHAIQLVFAALLAVLLCGIGFLLYSRVQLRRNLTLQKELAEYEQKALHLQMNPHFVFNCLGSISSFIVQNGTDEAIRYLAKFSKLMRLTLEYSKESLIPVDREIEGLQNYLELEQLRFNSVFSFEITKSTQIEDDMALPPLLLQPFVENAIIHGLIPGKEHGSIAIDFAIIDEQMVCTIKDNGIGFTNSQKLKEELVSVHKSMALDITKKRLEMMQAITSRSSKVEIAELSDEAGTITGTKVVLILPVQYITNKTSL